jgi:hypothetical protein
MPLRVALRPPGPEGSQPRDRGRPAYAAVALLGSRTDRMNERAAGAF